jgi:exopolysaccharide biosynthesis polyprenyl glycosylphosphotransferase
MGLIKRKDTKIFILYLTVDILLILFSFYPPFIQPFTVFLLRRYALIYSFWGITTMLLFNIYNLYRTQREITILEEILSVWKVIMFSSLSTGAIVFFSKTITLSKPIYVINFILLSIMLAGWRTIKRRVIRYLIVRGYDNFNVLIVGAGNAGKKLADEIDQRPYLGFKIVGFLDDDKEKQTTNGYKVLGGISEFAKIAQQNFVDEVLVTIPGAREKISQLIRQSKLLNVSLKIIPDQFDSSIHHLNGSTIGYIPVLEYIDKKIHGTEMATKRIMDLVLSGIGLILLLPLFIILVILIKMDSKGPAFYVSKRYGKKGRIFNFYKFRSMVVNAASMLSRLKDKNEADGPIFKMKNDPRITRIGRFIRKYSLDELPQLWNVFKGDMSIVGPRPLPLDQVENSDLKQLKRLGIKPGITGLWQVRGRSDASFRRLIRWDDWYIKNWSLGLDLRILAQTFPVVLKGKGAY